jgi:hypothetical protein
MTDIRVSITQQVSLSPDIRYGTHSQASYAGTTSVGLVIQPVAAVPATAGDDPELRWLASSEAKQHEGHWVALSPETGEYLGRADADADFRRWQRDGATLVFVEPPGYRAGV